MQTVLAIICSITSKQYSSLTRIRGNYIKGNFWWTRFKMRRAQGLHSFSAIAKELSRCRKRTVCRSTSTLELELKFSSYFRLQYSLLQLKVLNQPLLILFNQLCLEKTEWWC